MLDKIVKNKNSKFIDDDLTDLSWLVQWKEQTSFQNNVKTKSRKTSGSRINQEALAYCDVNKQQQRLAEQYRAISRIDAYNSGYNYEHQYVYHPSIASAYKTNNSPALHKNDKKRKEYYNDPYCCIDYVKKRFYYDQCTSQKENYYPQENSCYNNYICSSPFNNTSLAPPLLQTSTTSTVPASYYALTPPNSNEILFDDSCEQTLMPFDNIIQMHTIVDDCKLIKLDNNKSGTYPDDIEQLLEIFQNECDSTLSTETEETLKLITNQSSCYSNDIKNITNFH